MPYPSTAVLLHGGGLARRCSPPSLACLLVVVCLSCLPCSCPLMQAKARKNTEKTERVFQHDRLKIAAGKTVCINTEGEEKKTVQSILVTWTHTACLRLSLAYDLNTGRWNLYGFHHAPRSRRTGRQ